MRIFLIRHGETVDNVAGVYAGITDSALTNHGVIQADRLGQHLANAGVSISRIFSSDLQRAFRTAEAIRLAQSGRVEEHKPITALTQTVALLREQDFGFYERKKFVERSKGSNKIGRDAHHESHRDGHAFVDVESKESMQARCDAFLNQHLVDLVLGSEEEHAVVVVAHGIILGHLWRCILRRCGSVAMPGNSEVAMDDGAQSPENIGSWSNTGYLELELVPLKTKATEELSAFDESSHHPIARHVLGRMDAGGIELSSAGIGSPDGLGIETSSNSITHADTTSSPLKRALEMGVSRKLSSKQSLPGTTFIEPVTARCRTESEAISSEREHPRSLSNFSLVVHRINCVSHLKNLKKTRGGIGSLKHDESQKSIESFFKKRKIG